MWGYQKLGFWWLTMTAKRLLEKLAGEVDKLLNKLDGLAQKTRPYIPFTVLNTVWRSLDKRNESILDVGCGKGVPMRFINRRSQFYTVGVDIFEPYLRECKRQGIHNEYILANVGKLPFQRKSFDIVLCMEVLEHLEKEEGGKLLQAVEEIARNQVIITTPVGTYKQDAYDSNPYQEHKFIWNPAEMKALGYKVQRLGLCHMSGEDELMARLPRVIKLLNLIIWVAAGPLVRLIPLLAGHMVATKSLSPEGYSGKGKD